MSKIPASPLSTQYSTLTTGFVEPESRLSASESSWSKTCLSAYDTIADIRHRCEQRRMSTWVTAGPLNTFISPMRDLPAWGVKQGFGSFLTFEFGEPKLKIVERRSPDKGLRREAHVRGQWHLWIYCCHWRALDDGVQLAWSEDDQALIGRAMSVLDGQKLTEVRVAPEEGRSVFTFDLGGSLETWPYGDDPTEEQWTIQTDTEAFAYRADGHFSCEPSDTPRLLERWLPLR